jgi:glycosyltransferase involved in cell wall biosynthesis
MKTDVIKQIIIITSESFPYGMAGTNRVISLSKGFIDNSIDTRVLSIYKYGKPDEKLKFPVKGVYEGIEYLNILISGKWDHYRIMRVLKRSLKEILVFNYCLWKLHRGTLVLYYSPWMMPAMMIKIVTQLKGLVFIKEETEHPLVRIRDKGRLYKYLYLNFYYNIFDGLFVITHKLYEYCREDLCYIKPLLIVPMIVDTDSFNPKIDINKKQIVFSGELDVPKEGLDTLLSAFSKVLKKYPDYKLNLYGKPVDQAQEYHIIDLISKLNIRDNVILHGYLTRDELIGILLEADILMFTRPPSLQATYGFSTKLGEYLATGKPVVTTKVGEIDMFLTDELNAFVCESEIDSVAEKICKITENYEFGLKVGSQGRICVMEHFNNKIEAKNIIDYVRVTFH